MNNYLKSEMLFSGQVVSDSLGPRGLQHGRPLCPSPTPGVYSNSCSLSQGRHKTISSSAIRFTSHIQSFPASGSFKWVSSRIRWLKYWNFRSVLWMNIQDWFPLGLTGLMFLQSKGLSRVFSNTTVQRNQFFSAQPFLWSNSHIHTCLLEKPYGMSGPWIKANWKWSNRW